MLMFLIPLLLTLGLDLSRPEFIPETFDGDYIVGTVSGNDFEVERINSDGLSLSQASELTRISILQTIHDNPSDSSDYWEILLNDDFSSTVYNDTTVSVSSVSDIKFILITYPTPSNYYFYGVTPSSGWSAYYVPVTAGHDYVVSGFVGSDGLNVTYGVLDSDDFSTVPSVAYDTGFVTLNSSLPSSFSFHCTHSGYLYISCLNRVNFSSAVLDGTHIVGYTNLFTLYDELQTVNDSINDLEFNIGDVDVQVGDITVNLDELTSTMEELSDELHIKLKAILFVSLMAFLYPIALSIVHNVVGGKKDV